MPFCIDTPRPDAPCDPLGFRVEGWVADDKGAVITAVEIFLSSSLAGRTERIFIRDDVNAALNLPRTARCGFALQAEAPRAIFGQTADLIARAYSGSALSQEISLRVQFPSGGELVRLLKRTLGPPPCSVLELGCGSGWRGRQLLASGYAWHGAETKAEDCATMAASGLPHARVEGPELPFRDAGFDAAVVVETLEHAEDPRRLLREVRRVAPRRLIISVLKSGPTNAFTPSNLESLLREFYSRVEIIQHDELPIRPAENTPPQLGLFAIAESDA